MTAVRRFRHRNGFMGGIDCLEFSEHGCVMVRKDGRRERAWAYDIGFAEDAVALGIWVEDEKPDMFEKPLEYTI